MKKRILAASLAVLALTARTHTANALHELGVCIKQSEYGANFSTNDFEAEAARAEHEANGLVSMF